MAGTYPLYLRNKMPHYERPKVDSIQNLTPVIVVDQKPIGNGSRSTVGTAVDVAPLNPPAVFQSRSAQRGRLYGVFIQSSQRNLP